MSPVYEVSVIWTERYYASLPIEAASQEEARTKARAIWHDQPLNFLGSTSFETSRRGRPALSP